MKTSNRVITPIWLLKILRIRVATSWTKQWYVTIETGPGAGYINPELPRWHPLHRGVVAYITNTRKRGRWWYVGVTNSGNKTPYLQH